MSQLKKLSIKECRNFLKDKKSKEYINLYNMILFYVNKYDNLESQYMIQTSNKYEQKIEDIKIKLHEQRYKTKKN